MYLKGFCVYKNCIGGFARPSTFLLLTSARFVMGRAAILYTIDTRKPRSSTRLCGFGVILASKESKSPL